METNFTANNIILNDNNNNHNNNIIISYIVIEESSNVIISIGEKPEQCIICMEGDCNIILPCKHNIICLNCLNELIRNKNNMCPVCRNSFTNYYINT